MIESTYFRVVSNFQYFPLVFSHTRFSNVNSNITDEQKLPTMAFTDGAFVYEKIYRLTIA